jgi:hypothetical protein
MVGDTGNLLYALYANRKRILIIKFAGEDIFV